MKEHTKAIATYEEGLKQDPGNQELKDGLQRCMQALSSVSTVPDECMGSRDTAMTMRHASDLDM